MTTRTKNPCTICGKPGIAGMRRGSGKCLYHYNLGQFGIQAAERSRWNPGATFHSECNTVRVVFRPDQSQQNPWVVHIDAAGALPPITCATLEAVTTYLAGKGIRFRVKP